MKGRDKMPWVYVTRRIPAPALLYLKKRFECRLWDEENVPVPREVLLNEVAGAEGLYCLLSDRIDREVIDAAPYLKVISTMSAGFDHIDVQYARRRGVTVTHTPGVLTETTADLAFALILLTGRRLIEANRALYRGEWKAWGPLFMAGRDVHGATLGIVGMGRIGQAMVRRARGFNMKVCYFSRQRKKDLEEKEGILYLPLPELLKSCDYISLHVPATPETVGMIGSRELAMMKPTAVLINTSRGAVVDEDALYHALKSGTIYAAGLDVFAIEPVDPNHPLLHLPNVVALPHIGSASIETRYKMAQLAAEDLCRVLNGEQPRFPVL
jgi:glyoxylate reductase